MATIYVFTGDTYPYRRLFRDHGGEFYRRPNRWEVPAMGSGAIPYALSDLRGVTVTREVRSDPVPEVRVPQSPTAPATRGYLTREQTVANSEMIDSASYQEPPQIDDGVSREPEEDDCPF